MHTYTNTHKLNKQNRNNSRTTARPQQCNVCPPQLPSLMALDNAYRFVLEPSWAPECAWTRGCWGPPGARRAPAALSSPLQLDMINPCFPASPTHSWEAPHGDLCHLLASQQSAAIPLR